MSLKDKNYLTRVENSLSEISDEENRLERFLERFESDKLGLDSVFDEVGLSIRSTDLGVLSQDECLNAIGKLSDFEMISSSSDGLSKSILATASLMILANLKGYDLDSLPCGQSFSPIFYLSDVLQESVLNASPHISVNFHKRKELLKKILQEDGSLVGFFNDIVNLYKYQPDLAISLFREVLHEYHTNSQRIFHLSLADYVESMTDFLPDCKLIFAMTSDTGDLRSAYPPFSRYTNDFPVNNTNSAFLDLDFPNADELQDIFERFELGIFADDCNELTDIPPSFLTDYEVARIYDEAGNKKQKPSSFETLICKIVKDSNILSSLLFEDDSDFLIREDIDVRFALLRNILSELIDRSKYIVSKAKFNRTQYAPVYVKSYFEYINQFLSPLNQSLAGVQRSILIPKDDVGKDDEAELVLKAALPDETFGKISSEQCVNDITEEVSKDLAMFDKFEKALNERLPIILAEPLKFKKDKLLSDLKEELLGPLTNNPSAYFIYEQYVDSIILMYKNAK